LTGIATDSARGEDLHFEKKKRISGGPPGTTLKNQRGTSQRQKKKRKDFYRKKKRPRTPLSKRKPLAKSGGTAALCRIAKIVGGTSEGSASRKEKSSNAKKRSTAGRGGRGKAGTVRVKKQLSQMRRKKVGPHGEEARSRKE